MVYETNTAWNRMCKMYPAGSLKLLRDHQSKFWPFENTIQSKRARMIEQRVQKPCQNMIHLFTYVVMWSLTELRSVHEDLKWAQFLDFARFKSLNVPDQATPSLCLGESQLAYN